MDAIRSDKSPSHDGFFFQVPFYASSRIWKMIIFHELFVFDIDLRSIARAISDVSSLVDLLPKPHHPTITTMYCLLNRVLSSSCRPRPARQRRRLLALPDQLQRRRGPLHRHPPRHRQPGQGVQLPESRRWDHGQLSHILASVKDQNAPI